jgi:rsbT co-antagonist protein RsbR
MNSASRLSEIVSRHEAAILEDWVRQQTARGATGRVQEGEAREQSRVLLAAIREGLETGSSTDVDGPPWGPAKEFLTDFSRNRARQGFTPGETARFVFSLKLPLFSRLRQEYGNDAAALAAEVWAATQVIDGLGLLTIESYQKVREEVIARQQQELIELSTPVVKLWDGILALPMSGTWTALARRW